MGRRSGIELVLGEQCFKDANVQFKYERREVTWNGNSDSHSTIPHQHHVINAHHSKVIKNVSAGKWPDWPNDL